MDWVRDGVSGDSGDWVSDGASTESGGWVDDGPARNFEEELRQKEKELAARLRLINELSNKLEVYKKQCADKDNENKKLSKRIGELEKEVDKKKKESVDGNALLNLAKEATAQTKEAIAQAKKDAEERDAALAERDKCQKERDYFHSELRDARQERDDEKRAHAETTNKYNTSQATVKKVKAERDQYSRELQEAKTANEELSKKLAGQNSDAADESGADFVVAMLGGLVLASIVVLIPPIRRLLMESLNDSFSFAAVISLVVLTFLPIGFAFVLVVFLYGFIDISLVFTRRLVYALVIVIFGVYEIFFISFYDTRLDYALEKGQCLSADAVSVYSMDIKQIKDSVVDCDSSDAHLKVNKRVPADKLDKTDMGETFVVSFKDSNQAYGLNYISPLKVDQCFYRASEKNSEHWSVLPASFPCDTTLSAGQLKEFYDRYTTSYNPQFEWENDEPQFEWDKVKLLAEDVDEETCSKKLNGFSSRDNRCWSSLEKIKE